MKKRAAWVLALAIMAVSVLLGACGKTNGGDGAQGSVDVRVGALKGPTAMGMVKLMKDSDENKTEGNNYAFSISGAVDEIVPKIAQGSLDIAALPANLSSVIYNNTQGNVQVLAINTLGVLYIVENGASVQSIADLEGKTLYSSGKGASPEYALNYILEKNNLLGKVEIQWKSEHAECVAALMNDENGIALLPQPFVTTAQSQNEGLRVALDLTKEWDAVQQGEENPSAMLTGVVVVRKEFAEQNPGAVHLFMEQYAASVEYVKANNNNAAQLVEEYGILPAAVAEKALPECGIAFIEGDEMRVKLSGYLQVLHSQNPQAVGGSLPGDDFYYSR